MFARTTLSILMSLLGVALAGTANAAENVDSATTTAPTQKPVPQRSFSMALLAGHGFDQAFKTGFGGRVGYTLDNRVYLGAEFLYHAGTTSGPVQSHVWFGGAEAGYEFAAGSLLIRPYAGVGQASTTVTITLPEVGNAGGGRVTASDARLAFWPGATFTIPFEEGAAFIGLDTKLVVVDHGQAFNAYGTFGLAF